MILHGDVIDKLKEIPSNELSAYLAGVIDSDGSIMIKRSTWAMRNRNDTNWPVFSERIGIKLSTKRKENLTVLLIIKTKYGGSLREETKIYQSKSGFTSKYPTYTYIASDKKATKFVIDIYPYLIIKKKQAELLLKLRKSKNSAAAKRRGSPVGRLMSKEVTEEREELYEEIRRLNGR